MVDKLLHSETVASTVQPSQAPEAPAPSPGGLDLLALTGIGALGLWQIGRIVVRRFFKDSTEIAKDRAETNIVMILQEENTNLRKKYDELQERMEVMSKERNEAVSRLGRFLAETELYKAKIAELQQSVIAMTSKLEEQNILLRSVLIENAQLTSQVEHLAESNAELGIEIEGLRQKVSDMANPK